MRGIFLSILLAFIFQGCGNQVKPVLQEARPDISARIGMQQKRIQHSIIAGEILPAEARPLQADLQRIRQRYDHLKAEGGPTEKETESLARMLDENSEQIYEASQLRKKLHKW